VLYCQHCFHLFYSNLFYFIQFIYLFILFYFYSAFISKCEILQTGQGCNISDGVRRDQQKSLAQLPLSEDCKTKRTPVDLKVLDKNELEQEVVYL
jgi:hypothetical protein